MKKLFVLDWIFFFSLSVLVGAYLQSVFLEKTNFNLDTMVETEERKVAGWTTPFPFKGLVQQHKASSCVTCREFNNSTCGKLFKWFFLWLVMDFWNNEPSTLNFLQPPLLPCPTGRYDDTKIGCLYHSWRLNICKIDQVYNAPSVNRSITNQGGLEILFYFKSFYLMVWNSWWREIFDVYLFLIAKFCRPRKTETPEEPSLFV